MERDAAERYARHVLDDVFDGNASPRVRADLVATFSDAYVRAHGTEPSDAEFMTFLADRYDAATAPDAEGYTPEKHIDAEERLRTARQQGPVCTGCLGMMDYPTWIGNGMPQFQDGRPLMERDVTVRPNEVTTPSPGRVPADRAHTVEVAYRCPAGEHDTGFTAYHAMTDNEFERFRADAADGAAALRDALDMDDD